MSAEPIFTILNGYHNNTLLRIITEAGLDTKRPDGSRLRKRELIDKILTELFSASTIRATYASLTSLERRVLDALRGAGAFILTRRFKRMMIGAGIATASKQEDARSLYRNKYEGQPTPADSTVFEDILARLTLRGLVFSVTREHGASVLKLSPGARLLVPTEVSRHLPPLTKAPDWEPTSIDEPDPGRLVRDLYIYWDAVRRERIKLLKTSMVGKRDLRQLDAQLLASDPKAVDAARKEDELFYLLWLRRTLEAHNLLFVNSERNELFADEGYGEQVWAEPPAQLLLSALDAWIFYDALPPGTPTEIRSDRKLMRLEYYRQLLLSQLQQLPKDAWLPLYELHLQLQNADGSFLYEEREYLESIEGPYARSLHGDWLNSVEDYLELLDRREQHIITGDVEHALWRLGIVDIGRRPGPSGTTTGVRVTPFGRALLGDTAVRLPGPTGTPRIIVQPNFQILAMGPVPLSTLNRLDQIAERTKVDRNVFEYRLTRDSVYAALQADLDASMIIDFLTEQSDAPLPQNVRRSLADWTATVQRMVFHRGAALLQAETSEQMEAIIAATGAAVRRRLTDTLALVEPVTVDLLPGFLHTVDILPRRLGLDAESAAGGLNIAADGTVTTRHRYPGLRLTGRLAQIAAQDDSGGWRITRETVQRVGGDREANEALLEELAHMNGAPLPASLVERIKRWGAHFGTAEMAPVIIIAFQDEATLQELQQDRLLRQLLTPIVLKDRALALVAPADEAAVAERLEALGVPIDKRDTIPLGG